MMHRAARSLTINTSNACLVNKFNASSSSTSTSASTTSSIGGGRPYTPPPPSCRLHKIYEEKLEILGSLGYENWFDDHANPFYRHAEPDLSRRHLVRNHSSRSIKNHYSANAKADANANSISSDSPFDLVDIIIETIPSNSACMRPFQSQPQPLRTAAPIPDRITFSAEFTGFESLDSDDDDSEPGEEMIDFFGDDDADETRGLFFMGDHDSNARTGDLKKSHKSPTPATEIENRRLSNRNRIMDRGHLMPDTTVFLPLPLPREPRFVLGNKPSGNGGKIRSLSPYPRARSFLRQD